MLRWHRELVRRKWATFAGRPRRGRPSISEECRELIHELAKENARWGYLRLKGELRKLGFEVSASTIRRVLRQHRIPPAPRRSTLTWRSFLAAHAATIVATDFFSVDTVDSALAAEGTEVRRTPPRCPRANSIAERWVGSARCEALDWLLVLNECHLRCILKEYVEHYNRARPHRSLNLRPTTGDPPLGDGDAPVTVMTRLGGLLREYSRAAA